MKCQGCKDDTGIFIKEGQPNCRLCGSFARINSDNGYVEWVQDGRVFLCEELEREVWEHWKNIYPEQFKKAEKEGIGPHKEVK